MSLDTKSPLGVLTSQRRFTVESGLYDMLASKYTKALKASDTSKAERIRKDALAKWFNNRISPGQSKTVSIVRIGEPVAPDRVSCAIKWYPKADYLQVEADVIDAYFSTDSPDMPWMASAVEVFICPSGMAEDINQFIFTPKGEDGKAQIWSLLPGKASQVNATWKLTANGYSISARIPWSVIKGYEKDWSIMPVEAQVDSNTPTGLLQMEMNRYGAPVQSARTYAGLKRK
jgi:hypothetical protein